MVIESIINLCQKQDRTPRYTNMGVLLQLGKICTWHSEMCFDLPLDESFVSKIYIGMGSQVQLLDA